LGSRVIRMTFIARERFCSDLFGSTLADNCESRPRRPGAIYPLKGL
jgi:hypothetical protein